MLWHRGNWATEPAVGRVANGIADRVHRLKMLGNGQVPACTYVIGNFIKQIEQQTGGSYEYRTKHRTYCKWS